MNLTQDNAIQMSFWSNFHTFKYYTVIIMTFGKNLQSNALFFLQFFQP